MHFGYPLLVQSQHLNNFLNTYTVIANFPVSALLTHVKSDVIDNWILVSLEGTKELKTFLLDLKAEKKTLHVLSESLQSITGLMQ